MQQMLQASFEQLNTEFGFALAAVAGAAAAAVPRRARPHRAGTTRSTSAWARPGAWPRRVLPSSSGACCCPSCAWSSRSAAGELELWSKAASSQVEAQLRERRRAFTRRREALQRVQAAAGELEARIAEVEAQDEHLRETAGADRGAGRRGPGRRASARRRAGRAAARTAPAAGRGLTRGQADARAAAHAAAPAAAAGRARRALAAPPRPPRPALAGHARPLPRLAVRGHAAADAGRHRARLLPALPGALSQRAGAGRRAARRRAGAVERAGLLQPRAQPAPLRAGRWWPSTAARFPASSAALATLPGIGRSTAAAIAAFCFGERAAILDGNVKRVLTRALGFGDDLALAAEERRLWAAAEALLPARDVDVYTQGLMDLGATVCLARQPGLRALPAGRRLRGAPRRHARALPGEDAQAQARPARTRLAVAAAPRPRVAGAAAAARRVGRPVDACRSSSRRTRWRRPPPAGPGRATLAAGDRARADALRLDAAPAGLALAGAADVRPDLLDQPDPASSRWFTPEEALALGLPAPVRRLLEAAPG